MGIDGDDVMERDPTIDWDAIEKMQMDTSPEAEIRFNALCKRMLGQKTTPEEDALLAKRCKELGW
jgi:hypothetical protein